MIKRKTAPMITSKAVETNNALHHTPVLRADSMPINLDAIKRLEGHRA
jgi:hypothetical protein